MTALQHKPQKKSGRTTSDWYTESFMRCEETSVAMLQTLHQLPRRMAHCAIQPWNVGASSTRNC